MQYSGAQLNADVPRIRLLPEAERGRHTRRFCASGQLCGAIAVAIRSPGLECAVFLPYSGKGMPMLRLLILSVLLAGTLYAQSTAEQKVQDAIKSPELTVVHLWAPWCSNCQAELKTGGWSKTVNENRNVKFYFVSVWNDGQDGRAMLKKFGIADQPNVTILADPAPRRGENKVKQFAGLPLSWIPTTLIYKGGDLRYALNYGEVRFPVLQQFLADSQSEWSHKGEPSIE